MTATECGPNQKYCRDCGKLILERAEICPGCGCRQIGVSPVEGETTGRVCAGLRAGFASVRPGLLQGMKGLLQGLARLIFICFSVTVVIAFFREYRKYALHQVGLERVVLAGAIGSMFLYFGLNFFWRERQKRTKV
jgi:hypothetical protein